MTSQKSTKSALPEGWTLDPEHNGTFTAHKPFDGVLVEMTATSMEQLAAQTEAYEQDRAAAAKAAEQAAAEQAAAAASAEGAAA